MHKRFTYTKSYNSAQIFNVIFTILQSSPDSVEIWMPCLLSDCEFFDVSCSFFLSFVHAISGGCSPPQKKYYTRSHRPSLGKKEPNVRQWNFLPCFDVMSRFYAAVSDWEGRLCYKWLSYNFTEYLYAFKMNVCMLCAYKMHFCVMMGIEVFKSYQVEWVGELSLFN